MTKKHFIALADAIRDNQPTPDSDTRNEALLQWEADRNMLADFCQSQNPRFNRDRWLGYIDGKNGKNGGAIK